MKKYTLTPNPNVTGQFDLTFQIPNKNGEILQAIFTTCRHDRKNKHDLMNLWVKAGYLPEFIPEVWAVDTYVYNSAGECRRKYDPTIISYQKISRKTGKTLEDRYIINFAEMREATRENLQYLIKKLENMFYNCEPIPQKTEYI